MRVLLLFPPGWSMDVGGPHIALPLIKAILEENGIEAIIKDLNYEISNHYGIHIDYKEAIKAIKIGTFEALSNPFFKIEDKLERIAKNYDGEWSWRLGFNFKEFSPYSSKSVREALKHSSPFTEYFKCNTMPSIERINPIIIGFSITSIFQLIPSLHLSWLLRKAGYSGFIVFGGNTISRLKEDILLVPWIFDIVDGFIVFQGEFPLLYLSNEIRRGRDLSSVPNLIWRDKEKIKINSIIDYQNPDIIPTPDFRGLSVGNYWGVNYLPILGSRGCYYSKCKFCAIPYGYGKNGFSGTRKAELIFKDMIDLKSRYKIDKFKFMDEAIIPKLMISLSEMIIKNGIHVQWEGYLRLERNWLDEKYINKIVQSGFKKAYFGLEIYSDDARENLGKNDNAKELLDILKLCSDFGIKVHLFCMFGFPGTGLGEAEKTISFILNHSDMIDSVDLNPYKYARHTYVPGIDKIIDTEKDWALEYDYENKSEGTLAYKDLGAIVTEMEETLWKECPRLLHPIIRLVSPWNYIQYFQDNENKEYASDIL